MKLVVVSLIAFFVLGCQSNDGRDVTDFSLSLNIKRDFEKR